MNKLAAERRPTAPLLRPIRHRRPLSACQLPAGGTPAPQPRGRCDLHGGRCDLGLCSSVNGGTGERTGRGIGRSVSFWAEWSSWRRVLVRDADRELRQPMATPPHERDSGPDSVTHCNHAHDQPTSNNARPPLRRTADRMQPTRMPLSTHHRSTPAADGPRTVGNLHGSHRLPGNAEHLPCFHQRSVRPGRRTGRSPNLSGRQPTRLPMGIQSPRVSRNGTPSVPPR